MSSRQEEKERRRREREAQEAAAAKAASRGKRLRIVGAVLGALALAAAAVILITSSSSGDAGDGEPGSAADAPEVALPPVRDRNLESAAETAGCEPRTVESEGATHVETKVQYRNNPPTSGNHNPQAAPDGIYEPGNEPPPETWVHTLEHGRVIFQYKPGTPQKVIDQLEALAAEPLNGSDGYKTLVMQNNTGMEPQVVALAWTQELTCPEFSEGFFDAARAFRAAYTDKAPEFIPPN